MNVNQLQNNCAVITTAEGKFLQSYNSIIAQRKPDGAVVLDEKFWDYSTTTRKHRFLFLGEDSKTIKAKIASGEYTFADLNK